MTDIELPEVDAETLAQMKRFCGGEDPRAPRMIEVEALWHSSPEEWTLCEFRTLINEASSEIPEGCLTSAKVTLDGETCAFIKITYERPQTSAEVYKHFMWVLGHIKNAQREERVAYERLKAKFERPLEP